MTVGEFRTGDFIKVVDGIHKDYQQKKNLPCITSINGQKMENPLRVLS